MPEKGSNKGELPPEVDKYLSALIKDPKSKAFVPLADAYRRAGMLEEAIQVARDGLRYNPNYVSGHFVLGRCYFEKEMLKEAEDEISIVVKINPENADAQKILARIKERTGKSDEAIKIWDTVLTLAPNDVEAKQRIEELKKVLQVEEAKESQVEKEEVVEEKVEVEVEKKEEGVPSEVAESSERSVELEPVESPPSPAYEIPSPEVKQEQEACEVPLQKPEDEIAKPMAEQEAITEVQKPFEEPQPTLSKTSIPEEKMHIVEERISEVAKVEEPPTETTKEALEQKEMMTKEGTGISTRALAELYVKQGFLERALKVYKEIEASSPDDKEIKSQIDIITAELNKRKEKEPKEKFKENIKTLSSWLEKIKRGG